MSGFIGDDQVRRIRDAVDLVSVMGDYTTLQKSGQNFKCCCPFHQERSPSCYVYTSDNHYHCFGCKANGDVISLIMGKENIPFTEAIELLARRAGIIIEYQKGGATAKQRSEREAQLAAMEFAAEFYQKQLLEASSAGEARAYLAGRKLSYKTLKDFRVGWAPGNGQLYEAARKAGFQPELLRAIDLVHERNGRLSDRFFERITFPICDRFGAVLAFQARLLPAAERAAKEAGRGVGKYVNSGDTPLYSKGRVVFNLHHARTTCRQVGRIIVMEGPTDVMAAHQVGISECVAVLGTALTGEHSKQLANLVGEEGKVVLMLDGDAAGQDNAKRVLGVALGVGVSLRVCTLPEELDPAEVVQTHHDAPEKAREILEGVLSNSSSDLNHLLKAYAPTPARLEPRERLAVADKMLDILRTVPDTDLRDLYCRELARHLGEDAERLRRRMAGVEVRPPR